ncbi:hypothetical protein EL06_28250 [Salmonella enterica subsp. diarizonae]|uniref:Phage tail protein n=1 Tax=Salmonella diarizonae TaxID=59204 RepID=A0A6C8Y3X9_SALDZ|nr:hypothetical protein [Salmonella enterica subsp. diarizonae]
MSDANRDKLSAWLAYKNEDKAVDVTTAPENVNWPVPLGGVSQSGFEEHMKSLSYELFSIENKI